MNPNYKDNSTKISTNNYIIIKAFTFITILIFAMISGVSAQPGTIDTVYFYNQGEPEEEFKNNPNFPNNIFGIPSRIATRTVPASSPEEIEAIGINGEIIVGFKNKILRNGPGADFVIFENAFINQVTSTIFAEPAIVSVSQDGINYFEFPYNSETLSGFAGISPTIGNQDPFNPDVSGGDKFDIDILGLDYIKYIKIKDTTLIIKSLPSGNKYKNPDFLLTGFDLDAVVGLYLEDDNTISVNEYYADFKIRINSDILEVIPEDDFADISELSIYNILGNIVYSKSSNYHHVNLAILPKGLYFANIISGNNRRKFIKIIR